MINQQKNTFPQTYAGISNALLLKAYTEGPNRIKKCMKGLSEEELKKKLIDNKWSIFEILVHIADSEITGAVRVRQCYSQSDTRFPFYDQDIWAKKFGYQKQSLEDLKNALILFQSLRKTTYRIFLQCEETDWKKTGFHPESGEITLRNLLELYADHSERHIQQILQRRELLKQSIDLPMILEERPY